MRTRAFVLVVALTCFAASSCDEAANFVVTANGKEETIKATNYYFESHGCVSFYQQTRQVATICGVSAIRRVRRSA